MPFFRALSFLVLISLMGNLSCGVKAPPVARNSITPQQQDSQDEADKKKKQKPTT